MLLLPAKAPHGRGRVNVSDPPSRFASPVPVFGLGRRAVETAEIWDRSSLRNSSVWRNEEQFQQRIGRASGNEATRNMGKKDGGGRVKIQTGSEYFARGMRESEKTAA